MDHSGTGCPSPGPVRVYVAARHAVLIDRVAVLADQYEDLRLVGAQTSGSAAMASIMDARPGVVLVGDLFPDADGFDVCDGIRRALPCAALIFVSDARTDDALLRAVEAGACGVIAPLAADDELMMAILRAAEGELLLSRSTVHRLFQLGRELRCAGGAGEEHR
jgi:DNA-binding NarL/FixJ family response regulator